MSGGRQNALKCVFKNGLGRLAWDQVKGLPGPGQSVEQFRYKNIGMGGGEAAANAYIVSFLRARARA